MNSTLLSSAARLSLRLSKRWLLSSSYSLKNVWQNRLSSPHLKDIDCHVMALNLSNTLDEKPVDAIDLDIAVNAIPKLEGGDESEYIDAVMRKFRKSLNCHQMLDSTSYAFIRAHIDSGHLKELLDKIEDKNSYGLFLDHHSATLLLDHFIETKNYEDAMKVVRDLMEQEHFSIGSTSQLLSLLACSKYLNSRSKNFFNPPSIISSPEVDEDEIEYIPIKYIYRPVFDDHFDLFHKTHILGKSMLLLAFSLKPSRSNTKGNFLAHFTGAAISQKGFHLIKNSYTVLGYGLWDKFDSSLNTMKILLDSDVRDSALIASTAVDCVQSQLVNVETKEEAESKWVSDIMDQFIDKKILALKPTSAEKDELISKFNELKTKLLDDNKIVNENLDAIVEDFVKERLSESEKREIQVWTDNFDRWEKERDSFIKRQIEFAEIEQKRQAIKDKLKEIKEKEELISFFSQWDKIDSALLNTEYFDKENAFEEYIEDKEYQEERDRWFAERQVEAHELGNIPFHIDPYRKERFTAGVARKIPPRL